MKVDFLEEERYLLAKKRVKKIKGFYAHLFWYVLVNIFLSIVIVYGIMKDGNESFYDAIGNFGVYSTWLFWGIGVFFHALGVFDYGNLLSKKWEEDKIQELMKKEEEKQKRISKL